MPSRLYPKADLPELLAQLVDHLNEPWGEIALLDIASMAESVFEDDGNEDAMTTEEYEKYSEKVWDLIELLKGIAHV